MEEPPVEKADNGLSYRDLTAAMGDRVEDSKINELTTEPEEEKIEIPENFSFENGPVIEESVPAETQPYQPEEVAAYEPLDTPAYSPMDPLDLDALKEEASQIDIKPPVMERPAEDGKAVMMEDFAFDSSSSSEADQPVMPIQEEALLPPKPLRRRRKTNWLLVVVVVLVVVLLLLVIALKLTGVI